MGDQIQAVYIADAVRTPIGKAGGALAHVRPDDLAAGALAALVARAPQLDPARIDDVHLGNGNGAGEENRNVTRMSLLLAGLPPTVPGATQNRLCGSGLEAVIAASREVAVGDADVVIAGGVESMSRAPWVVQKPATAYEHGHQVMHSTTLGWRMVNPRHDQQSTVALGEGAEILADRYSITHEAQDEFAARSHRLAAAAWTGATFADEIVAPFGADLSVDESVRRDSSVENLAKLRPVFRSPADGGSVTAGNSSPLNDGAAVLLLASEDGLATIGRQPLARIAGRAVSGIEPHLFGLGPVEAARTAVLRAGIGWADLRTVELNEAFAAQSLACLAELPELDSATVNPYGGAIAIGHPIGASGARILTTLVHHLHLNGGGFGLATMCIGVGQGITIVIEAF